MCDDQNECNGEAKCNFISFAALPGVPTYGMTNMLTKKKKKKMRALGNFKNCAFRSRQYGILIFYSCQIQCNWLDEISHRYLFIYVVSSIYYVDTHLPFEERPSSRDRAWVSLELAGLVSLFCASSILVTVLKMSSFSYSYFVPVL